MDDFSQYSDKMLAENYRCSIATANKISKELEKRGFKAKGSHVAGVFVHQFYKTTTETI